MSQMSHRARTWIIVFLSITVLALGLELWASFDNDPNTWPWTDLIVEYVPFEITMAVIGALALWIVIHFIIRYRRRNKLRGEDW